MKKKTLRLDPSGLPGPPAGGSGEEEESVIGMVDDLINMAVEKHVTDIHMEPFEEIAVIRMRMDGVLRKYRELPLEFFGKAINRVKVISSMDITRRTIPQRGFHKRVVSERKVEMDVFGFPSLFGEKLVIKIHFRRTLQHELPQLGITGPIVEKFTEILDRPNGLILVAGPPGSGKNSTLYAALNHLNAPHKSVSTLETIIKYEIPGLTTGKYDGKVDFTFEEALRSLMNQEPDVLMCGEIQSSETARILIQGSFSKRIVLGRMLANDTCTAVQTLLDMGIQSFLVSAAISAILAQRLVRRLCSHCRKAYHPSEEVQKEIGFRFPPATKFFKAVGCSACNKLGYRGHLGLFELLVPTEDVRDRIVARVGTEVLRQAAVQGGMATLKQDGISKVMQGLTTIEEVLNVL